MADSVSEMATQIERRVGGKVGNFSTNKPGRTNLTNIVSPNSRSRFVMPASFFIGNDKTIKLRIWGTRSGPGNKTIRFGVLTDKSFDKYQELHAISLNASKGDYYLEIVITAISRHAQSIHSSYITNSGVATLTNSFSAVSFSADRIFRIYGETTSAKATLTVSRYEMFVCG